MAELLFLLSLLAIKEEGVMSAWSGASSCRNPIHGSISAVLNPGIFTSVVCNQSRILPTSTRKGKTLCALARMSHDERLPSPHIPIPSPTPTPSSSSNTVSGQASPPVVLPADAKVSIREITSRVEYDEFLLGYDMDAESNDDDDDRLAMIYFHASWCKSCAKFRRKMDRFAVEMADWIEKGEKATSIKHRLVGDGGGAQRRWKGKSSSSSLAKNVVMRRGAMRLASVEWTTNKALCQHIQIDRLPTVQFIQKGGEIVEQFECPPSQFCKVQNYARYYLKRQSAMATKDALEHDLQRGQGLIQDLLASDDFVPNSSSKSLGMMTATARTMKSSSDLSKPSKPIAPSSRKSRLVHSLLKRMSGRSDREKLHSDSTEASSSVTPLATTEFQSHGHHVK